MMTTGGRICVEKFMRIFSSGRSETEKAPFLVQGARFDEYKDAMFWLSDAMIVNNCYNSTEPNIGLSLNLDRTLFLKCCMGDTGLLISHAFSENGEVSSENLQKKLFVR